MNKNVSYFLFLLWLCYLIVSSILLFTRGFLLTRTVQKNNSTCENFCPLQNRLINNDDSTELCPTNDDELINFINKASEICLPQRAKVVILLIDALRYDFTLYDENLMKPLPYQNKLPVIERLVKEHPSHSKLYKFIADPPTTTMQRLKALTTGSLPTFIDAGSNFATYEINEDNLIDQIVRNSYNAVFIGDDTWNGLYPNRFLRNYPYPSFNVWDLDTVDDGVRLNLYPELNRTDWNLLIGHFLGVDHCGHRYGPNHPEMERKLSEINDVIRNTVNHIDSHDDNYILFVIGDHGMTSTGDHGGESADEITSALFVYSKRPLINFNANKNLVKQVDLVPTLSTILGVPIPFQNLGILILDIIPVSNITNVWKFIVFSLWSNVEQMVRYIREYPGKEDVFNDEFLDDYISKYENLKNKIEFVNEINFVDFAREIVEFLTRVRSKCEEVWVQFESFSMARGLLFNFLSIFFFYIIVDGIPVSRLLEIFNSSFITCSYTVLTISTAVTFMLHFLKFLNNKLIDCIFFATGLVSQVMLGMLIIQNWEIISLNWYAKSRKEKFPNLVCRIVLIFNLCGLFSNSYIIEEGFVLQFLLISVILFNAISIVSINKKKRSKRPKLKLLIPTLIVAIFLRFSTYFFKCREEQQWCYQVSFILNKSETTKLQWALTVIFLIIFVFTTKEWLKSCGNLNGYSWTVLTVKYLPTINVVCIAGFWVLKRAPKSKNIDAFKSLNMLAWTVYGLTIIGILVCVLQPLCTYLIPKRSDRSVESIVRKLKDFFADKSRDNEDIPVICGLGTVYGTVFFIIGIYLTLLFALLLGDAIAPATVIMYATAMFVLVVTSVIRIENALVIDDLFNIPNTSVLIWIILAQYFFYATGHQPSFPNIAWETAFIGTSGLFNNNNLIPGALIIINTFCSYILMGVLLPLILITPFTIFVMLPSIFNKKFELLSERGEVVLYEKKNMMFSAMLTLSCKYIAGHGIRVFASMLAATIHCRHLMVWNIFAPKLIFESIGMFVTITSVLAGYLMLVRINKKVEGLIVKLTKMS